MKNLEEINKLLEESKENLKRSEGALQQIIEDQINFYQKELQLLESEEKRRVALIALNANHYSDRFIANVIGFLNQLESDTKYYDQFILTHTLQLEIKGLSDKTNQLNTDLIELVYRVKNKCESIYAHLYALIKTEIDQVSLKIKTGEMKIEPFTVLDMNTMLSKMLNNFSSIEDVEDLFRFVEYLKIMEDFLQEEIRESEILDKEEKNLLLDTQVKLKRLLEQASEKLRKKS